MPKAAAADGTPLHFEARGQGEPLLLLAAQASDHREWEGVCEDFAPHHQVIVMGYRGTGQSGQPAPYAGFAMLDGRPPGI